MLVYIVYFIYSFILLFISIGVSSLSTINQIPSVKNLDDINISLYSCISSSIASSRVILTDKQLLHMIEKHPDSYNDVILKLNETLSEPDYILKDSKHPNTGLIIKKIASNLSNIEHSFVVLKICTDSKNGKYANSVISGWKISNKRLENYLNNSTILYKSPKF